jgi:hypothetical protein
METLGDSFVSGCGSPYYHTRISPYLRKAPDRSSSIVDQQAVIWSIVGNPAILRAGRATNGLRRQFGRVCADSCTYMTAEELGSRGFPNHLAAYLDH